MTDNIEAMIEPLLKLHDDSDDAVSGEYGTYWYEEDGWRAAVREAAIDVVIAALTEMECYFVWDGRAACADMRPPYAEGCDRCRAIVAWQAKRLRAS